MKDGTKKIHLVVLFDAIFLLSAFTTERTFYIATEHPMATYYNRKYASNVSITATRYSRRDPMYYMNMQAETLVDFDNNITLNFYAIQFPNNGPLLFELHYKWCNMVYKDNIIGPLIRKVLPPECPTPKGKYKVTNVTTANVPSLFIQHLPFTKARIYMNATIFNEKLVEGHIDIEVKRLKSRT